jgi:glutamine amidotransferase PdxT
MKKNKLFNFSYVFFIALIFSQYSCNEHDAYIAEHANKIIHAGVFTGNGASSVCVIETIEALKIDPGIKPYPVTAYEIMDGILDELDVLIFPGGSGSKEYNNLGMEAGKLVKEFAKQKDKGLVGICAGGYLLATSPGYPSLEVLPAKTIREHYDRGRGLISFFIDENILEVFPEFSGMDSAFVQFYDGPIYEISDSSRMNVLGQIKSDIATHSDDPLGVTPGKPAFATMNYGNGKAFISVGHPESTQGMRWMVPRMVRWVANEALISYDSAIVKPYIYSSQILYYPDLIRYEKQNFWKLFDDNDSTVIKALEDLHVIYSRPSIRWAIGLLRHQSPKVRMAASNYLLEAEYTYSIPDMESAYKKENDPEAKECLKKNLNRLENIIR